MPAFYPAFRSGALPTTGRVLWTRAYLLSGFLTAQLSYNFTGLKTGHCNNIRNPGGTIPVRSTFNDKGSQVATKPTRIDFDGLCPLLQVFDMPTSVKFYCEVLGFELTGNSPIVHARDGDYFHWCILRRGASTIMLNTAYDEGERPPSPDAARFAAHSDTALFFGCLDVDAFYSQLLPLGINVLEKPNTTVYNMRRFTVADPDGYNLSFQGPVPAQ